MNFVFFQAGLNFHTCVKFRCLHFAPRVLSGREINLANLKQKMSIFVLVGLGILLRLESDHIPRSGWCRVQAHVVESRQINRA